VSHALSQAALDPAALARAIALGLLLCARFAPLAWLAPWLAVRGSPAPLGLAVTLLLALCAWPAAAQAAGALPLSLWTLLALGLREALIGFVYALALALPLLLLQWAGRFYGRFGGLAFAEHALGTLQLWLGVAVFFALGGHRVALGLLTDSVLRMPVGGATALPDLGAVALGSARLIGEAFATALLLALPVAAAIGLCELGVALAARLATAPGTSLVLAPARAALGLLVVWIATVLLVDVLPELLRHGLGAARGLWSTP
jgi:flagellar biosynthetic protein FliR